MFEIHIKMCIFVNGNEKDALLAVNVSHLRCRLSGLKINGCLLLTLANRDPHGTTMPCYVRLFTARIG